MSRTKRLNFNSVTSNVCSLENDIHRHAPSNKQVILSCPEYLENTFYLSVFITKLIQKLQNIRLRFHDVVLAFGFRRITVSHSV